eukprot:6048776-Pleurochrysis_carterae.AAC.1
MQGLSHTPSRTRIKDSVATHQHGAKYPAVHFPFAIARGSRGEGGEGSEAPFNTEGALSKGEGGQTGLC